MPKLVFNSTLKGALAVLSVGLLGAVAVNTGVPTSDITPPAPSVSPSPTPGALVSSTMLTAGGESGVGSFTVEMENTGEPINATLVVRCLEAGSVVFEKTLKTTLENGTSSRVFTSEAISLEGVTCTATI